MIVRKSATSFANPLAPIAQQRAGLRQSFPRRLVRDKLGVFSRWSVGVPERSPAHSAGAFPGGLYRSHGRQGAGGIRAFTLVELLIVIVIIVILISAVLVASSALFTKAKVSSTQALLTVVRDAVEQFKREQTAGPSISRNAAYRTRYGAFPPDELEVFSSAEVFPGGPANRSFAVGQAEIFPQPKYDPMKFYTIGLPPDEQAMEHRDIAAMIVAIQDLGDASAAILDRVQDRYWLAPLDPNDDPSVFLDKNGNGTWDSDDHQIRYIIDDWGNPLSYLAQRDWVQPPNTPPKSSNHGDWNEASSTLIRLNGGQPVIMSYGPNGKEQLTQNAMGGSADVSIVGDFAGLGLGSTQGKIDHLLNADNIYADPTLREKLAQ